MISAPRPLRSNTNRSIVQRSTIFFFHLRELEALMSFSPDHFETLTVLFTVRAPSRTEQAESVVPLIRDDDDDGEEGG